MSKNVNNNDLSITPPVKYSKTTVSPMQFKPLNNIFSKSIFALETLQNIVAI